MGGKRCKGGIQDLKAISNDLWFEQGLLPIRPHTVIIIDVLKANFLP
jgi:hypothetical protein